jgi:DNA-binding NarL/FixJ family response regulator
MTMALGLLIVDDHVGFRGLAASLAESAGFEVVGSVGTASAAVAAASELRPDAVLLDVQLPDLSGFEIVAELHSAGAIVVLTSTRSAEDYGGRVVRSGADAFVRKDELTCVSLRQAVRLADTGGA